jgi:hypothetical protein
MYLTFGGSNLLLVISATEIMYKNIPIKSVHINTLTVFVPYLYLVMQHTYSNPRCNMYL